MLLFVLGGVARHAAAGRWIYTSFLLVNAAEPSDGHRRSRRCAGVGRGPRCGSAARRKPPALPTTRRRDAPDWRPAVAGPRGGGARDGFTFASDDAASRVTLAASTTPGGALSGRVMCTSVVRITPSVGGDPQGRAECVVSTLLSTRRRSITRITGDHDLTWTDSVLHVTSGDAPSADVSQADSGDYGSRRSRNRVPPSTLDCFPLIAGPRQPGWTSPSLS